MKKFYFLLYCLFLFKLFLRIFIVVERFRMFGLNSMATYTSMGVGKMVAQRYVVYLKHGKKYLPRRAKCGCQ